MRRIRFHLRTPMAEYGDRRGQRLTYDELTASTGISTNSLSHIANNKQKMFARSVLERLCDFFGCELSDLMDLADP